MGLWRGKSASGGTTTEKATNFWVAAVGLGVVVAGGLLLWVSNKTWVDGSGALKTTLNQAGGLFITAGGLSLIWELFGKRQIMSEVLEKTRVSADVHAAGIRRASMDWTEVDWPELFHGAKSISIFISYGSAWRSNHWSKLCKFVEKEDNKLRVYLPNPEDELTMRTLAHRYEYSVDELKGKVLESARQFAKLGRDGEADVRVYYRAGDHTYTCYKFDDDILVTLYSNSRSRGDVPAMQLRNGSFYDFFVKELKAIEGHSEPVPLDEI